MESQLTTQNTQPANVVDQLKVVFEKENIKKRFFDVLGKKAPQFMASVTNAVSKNYMLKQCDANSIIGAAFVAATYDLPIDSNLGFAAIVPYNNSKWNPHTKQYDSHMEAQFQIMYKGFIQLAIRSGYYEKMYYAKVYEDELKSFNPITGEITYVDDFSKCTQRKNGEDDKIIGYYAWFKLNNGFSKELYMTKEECDLHARTYSQAYRKDIKDNKKKSLWSTNFETMASKTVIKLLLSKWGMLSIEMQKALEDDQKIYDSNGNGSYEDNQPDVDETEDPFSQIPEVEPETIDAEDVEVIDITE